MTDFIARHHDAGTKYLPLNEEKFGYETEIYWRFVGDIDSNGLCDFADG
jgi:hypothetical protein